MADLSTKKVVVLATNGFEDSELTSPVEALKNAGAAITIASTKTDAIKGKNGTEVAVDKSTAEVTADDFDAVLLPGGVNNSDTIRTDEKAVALVKALREQGKPLGVICHGGSIMTDADVLKGIRMTSYPSIKTDLINAGATWVDEECVVDNGVVSSRTPADLDAFNKAIVEQFA